MKKTLKIAVILTMTVIALASCGGSDENETENLILGTWTAGKIVQWQVINGVKSEEINTPATNPANTYLYSSDGTLIITTASGISPRTWSISNKTLTIKMPSGEESSYEIILIEDKNMQLEVITTLPNGEGHRVHYYFK
jgi:hypothetical protein